MDALEKAVNGSYSFGQPSRPDKTTNFLYFCNDRNGIFFCDFSLKFMAPRGDFGQAIGESVDFGGRRHIEGLNTP